MLYILELFNLHHNLGDKCSVWYPERLSTLLKGSKVSLPAQNQTGGTRSHLVTLDNRLRRKTGESWYGQSSDAQSLACTTTSCLYEVLGLFSFPPVLPVWWWLEYSGPALSSTSLARIPGLLGPWWWKRVSWYSAQRPQKDGGQTLKLLLSTLLGFSSSEGNFSPAPWACPST